MVEENCGDKLTASADFNGPTSNRKCTDLFCTLLLVTSWALLSYIGYFGITNGDYRTVLYPMDYDGNVCGTKYGDVDMTEFKYLYPINFYSSGVCLKECPSVSNPPIDLDVLITKNGVFKVNDNGDNIMVSIADYSSSPNVQTCTMDDCYPLGIPILSWESDGINKGAGYAFYLLDTTSYMNRCLPSSNSIYYLREYLLNNNDDPNTNQTTSGSIIGTGSASINDFSSLSKSLENADSVIGNLYSDLFSARKFILVFGLVVSVLIGFAYSFILRIPGLLVLSVWSSIFLTIGVLAYTGYYIYAETQLWLAEDPLTKTNNEILVAQIIGYVVWAIAALLFFLIISLRKRIQLALGIVREAAKAIADMPLLIVFPVLQCMGFIVYTIIWFVYGIYLASVGEFSTSSITVNDVTVTVRDFDYTPEVKAAGYYLIFSYFWTSQFIIAMGEIVMAVAVATWFFTRNKSEIGNKTVLASICNSFFYHTGTAAFGSLIIASIKLIRAVLAYIQAKLGKSGNRMAITIMACLQCLMWCFEKCMKFLNKNAYIQTAIFSTSFCPSAKAAFFLILRNAARVGTLSVITSIVSLIGRVLICAVTGGVFYIVLEEQLGNDIYSPVGPTAVVLILSFFTGTMFTNIFEMAISTILQCFIADEEMSNGDSDVCFASKSLQSYIEKSSRHSVSKTSAAIAP